MYSVALVQNQSEMSHYACADARSMLTDYDCRLFTGDDIAELSAVMRRRQVHAVVLGSNALNDKDILATLCCDEFAAVSRDFLASGRGLLCMQQIGLAMRKGPTLTLVPPPYNRLLPKVISADDMALRSGKLGIGSARAPHLTLCYPSVIDLKAVRDAAIEFRGYRGLYWHFWDEVDLADWDQVIVDPSGTEVRSLVLASKESSPGRVVVSALPLDWQKQEELFHNLLLYVVEGRHNLAALSVKDDDSFDYLRETLRARCQPFGNYTVPEHLSDAVRNLKQGIHSTLLVGPGVAVDDLAVSLKQTLESEVSAGRLRIVDIGVGAFNIRNVSVTSHELRPRRLLVAAEMQIQAELRTGYIDDSFWSHVETLQTLEQMPDGLVGYSGMQSAAFAIVRNHDRNGSYDELFGPTCALYWLRAAYRGVEAEETRQTAAWLRRNLKGQEANDRALAYHAFASVGTLTAEDRADLTAAVQSLDLSTVTESQLITYLRAAWAADLPATHLSRLALALTGRQYSGLWVDLTTTATAANSLLNALESLRKSSADELVLGNIEAAVRGAIIRILQKLSEAEDLPEPRPYPWEGKARTTTKCLQAWLRFESLQDLPVFELMENLGRSSRSAQSYAANSAALAVLQEISVENRDLRSENACQSRHLGRLTGRNRLFTVALAVAAMLLYVLGTLDVGLAKESHGILHAIKASFVDWWAFHLAILGLVVGVIGIVPILRKRDQQDATSN
jgi:hypothetical protein